MKAPKRVLNSWVSKFLAWVQVGSNSECIFFNLKFIWQLQGCVHARHPSSLSVLFIHGWHPQIEKLSIIFSMDDTFIYGSDFSVHGWCWRMKILSMDKMFSSMDRIFICHVFVWKFYVLYFQMRVLLHVALGFIVFFQFSPKNIKNKNSIHGWKDFIHG